MPVYPFVCGDCGPFELRRAVTEAAAPAACPGCRREGRRVWAPPGLVRTPAWKRDALGREERSAHEPEVVGRPQGRPLPHAHGRQAPMPWMLAGH
jgi:putative FmdB family regulatory protein